MAATMAGAAPWFFVVGLVVWRGATGGLDLSFSWAQVPTMIGAALGGLAYGRLVVDLPRLAWDRANRLFAAEQAEWELANLSDRERFLRGLS